MVEKMKKILFFIAAAALSLLTGCAGNRLFTGGNDGIHLLQYTNYGIPGWSGWSVEKKTPADHISYMAAGGNTLYAARRAAKGVFHVKSFRIGKNGSLQELGTFVIPGNSGYCHISLSQDGKFLFGSSYSGSFLDVLALAPAGGVKGLEKRFFFEGSSIHKRQKKSHPHFAAQIPGSSTVLVADLGSDKLHSFKYDAAKGMQQGKSFSLPQGSGPRHLSFSADGKLIFCANELNNTVSAFQLQKGELKLTDTCYILPEEWRGRSFAGAIKTAPDGRIFVTNRGHNSIAVLSCTAAGKLKLEQIFPAEGNFPYDLVFSGSEMFSVNMKSSQLLVWEKDPKWKAAAVLKLHRPMCAVEFPEFK